MNAALAFVSIMNVNHRPVRRNTDLAKAGKNVALAFVSIINVNHGGKMPSTKCYDEEIHTYIARSIRDFREIMHTF